MQRLRDSQELRVFALAEAAALDLAVKASSEPGQPHPQSLSDRFLRDVVAEVEKRHGSPFVADYVRLDLWATRA